MTQPDQYTVHSETPAPDTGPTDMLASIAEIGERRNMADARQRDLSIAFRTRVELALRDAAARVVEPAAALTEIRGYLEQFDAAWDQTWNLTLEQLRELDARPFETRCLPLPDDDVQKSE